MLRSIPPIAGREAELQALMRNNAPLWTGSSDLSLDRMRSAFACALHMHQPTIPAGVDGALISHLQYMFEHPGEGDNHNAEPFAQCYRRMADLIPQLIGEGCSPRIMLDYSGNLLWGVGQMGRDDITGALQHLACDPQMQRHVEWLGSFWSHAVAPSTPIPDLKLQISAWQHQFADLFGCEALARVRGFSPPEMHLPNHPDTLHAFISALKEHGYRWLLVQEHSVETLQGEPLSQQQKYQPNRLVARNSCGDSVEITALIKTQGSDTKLVGQMQPCYEAMGLQPENLEGRITPPLVSQIADGENGGVMMNEFPEAFRQANRRIRDSGDGCVAVNGTEYLELLEASGVDGTGFPPIQAVQQQRLWNAVSRTPSPQSVQKAIDQLHSEGDGFHMNGASWTNDLSWVQGYDNVLEPMQQLSAHFHARWDDAVTEQPSTTEDAAYQACLLHLLLSETSCFRYWGQGVWTDYARTLVQKGEALLQQMPIAGTLQTSSFG